MHYITNSYRNGVTHAVASGRERDLESIALRVHLPQDRTDIYRGMCDSTGSANAFRYVLGSAYVHTDVYRHVHGHVQGQSHTRAHTHVQQHRRSWGKRSGYIAFTNKEEPTCMRSRPGVSITNIITSMSGASVHEVTQWCQHTWAENQSTEQHRPAWHGVTSRQIFRGLHMT